jgi:hypothetical protein
MVGGSKPLLIDRFSVVAGDESDWNFPLVIVGRGGAAVLQFRIQEVTRLAESDHVRFDSLNLSGF